MTTKRIGYLAGVLAALVLLILLLVVAIRRHPFARSPITYDRTALQRAIDVPPPPTPDAPRPTSWHLRGVVVDRDGHAVEHALVSWFAPSEAARLCVVSTPGDGRHTVSQQDGRFTLTIGGDEPWLVVRHPMYLPWHRALRRADDVTEPVEVVLETGDAIRGTVVARDLGPVSDVTVMAMATGGDLPSVSRLDSVLWGPRADVHITQSDSNGRFEFHGLTAAEYEIEVCKEGMLRERGFEEHVVAAPGADVRLQVVPYAYALFELVDRETGKSVRSLRRVVVLPSVPQHDSRMLWHTDLWIGESTLHSEWCGLYAWIVGLRQWPIPSDAVGEVEAIMVGYKPTKAKVPLFSPWGQGGARVTRIALERERDSGVLKLRFADRDGRDLTNLRVRLVLSNETGDWTCTAHLTPGSGGTDEIVLPAGVYQEYESAEMTRAWDAPPVTVVAGDSADWTLRLRQSFVHLEVVTEPEGTEGTAPMFAAGGIAYAPGAGPVRPTIQDGGKVEGGRIPLTELRSPGGQGWVLGPLDAGTFSFAVDVPNWERGTSTVELKPGVVNEVTVRLRPKQR